MSFWISNLDRRPIPPDTLLPRSCNVCIIGAGLTGCSLAYYLAEYDVPDVLLLEANAYVAHGATGRNGGHLSPSPSRLDPQIYNFDKRTTSLVRAFLQSQEEVVQRGCELYTTGLLSYKRGTAAVEDHAVKLAERFPPMEGSRLVSDTTPIPSLQGTHQKAILTDSGAQVYPARLVHAMWEAAQRKAKEKGLLLTTVQRKVSQVVEGAVLTEQEERIECRSVVYCGNAYGLHLLPSWLQAIVQPVRGQCVASQGGLSLRQWMSGSWTDEGGDQYVIQRRSDGRYILGGKRFLAPHQDVGNTDDSTVDPTVREALQSVLKELHPEAVVEFEWTGLMAFTPDGLPVVGEVQPGYYVLCGYTGHGMVRASGCAEALARVLSGMADSLKGLIPDTFDAARFRTV